MPKKELSLPSPDIIARPVTPKEAIAFWKQRAKLTDDEARQLEKEARQRAFYVTGLAQEALVKLVSDALREALAQGGTIEAFQRRILPAIEKQGWHGSRIENIFRTNMQIAYAAGRYKKMQAVKKTRPYWQYIAVMDKRVRQAHAALNGLVYPADHAFWDTNYPPNGFRCRCGVRTLSARQVDEMGVTVQTEMPGSGGADAGFHNNPGRDWVLGAAHDKMAVALGVKKGDPMGIQEAAKGTNPLYGKGNGYKENCQRCVITYELRRRGYPVEALPYSEQDASKGDYLWVTKGFDGVNVVGRQADQILSKRQLLNTLKQKPDGARFGISWYYKQGNYGHVIACEKLDGKLHFIDAQDGVMGKSVLGTADQWGYSYFRMDDLSLNSDFKWDEIATRGTHEH